MQLKRMTRDLIVLSIFIFVISSLLYLYFYSTKGTMDLYLGRGCDLDLGGPYRLEHAEFASATYKKTGVMGFLDPRRRTEVTVFRIVRTGAPRPAWKRLYSLRRAGGASMALTVRCDGRRVRLEFKGRAEEIRSVEESLLGQLKASRFKRVERVGNPEQAGAEGMHALSEGDVHR